MAKLPKGLTVLFNYLRAHSSYKCAQARMYLGMYMISRFRMRLHQPINAEAAEKSLSNNACGCIGRTALPARCCKTGPAQVPFEIIHTATSKQQ